MNSIFVMNSVLPGRWLICKDTVMKTGYYVSKPLFEFSEIKVSKNLNDGSVNVEK